MYLFIFNFIFSYFLSSIYLPHSIKLDKVLMINTEIIEINWTVEICFPSSILSIITHRQIPFFSSKFLIILSFYRFHCSECSLVIVCVFFLMRFVFEKKDWNVWTMIVIASFDPFFISIHYVNLWTY